MKIGPIFALAWAGAFLLFAACGTAPAEPSDAQDAQDAQAFDDVSGADQGGEVACSEGDTLDLSQRAPVHNLESAATEFTVRFESFRCPASPSEFVFRFDLTNHTGDISGFDHDLDRSARLTTDAGAVVTEGFVYEVLSADDHHPAGLLRAPAAVNGAPVVDCQTTELRLELVGVTVPADQVLTFSWETELLDLLRDCS